MDYISPNKTLAIYNSRREEKDGERVRGTHMNIHSDLEKRTKREEERKPDTANTVTDMAYWSVVNTSSSSREWENIISERTVGGIKTGNGCRVRWLRGCK